MAKTRDAAAGLHVSLPEFDDFWHGRQITVAEQIPDRVYILEKFRTDPKTHVANTLRQDRTVFGKDRRLQLRRLRRPSEVVRQAGMAGR